MKSFWMPTRAIAACIGLLGFAVAIMSGLLSGASADLVLLRAILAMAGCLMLARAVLWATNLCLKEHVSEFMDANPVPNSSGVVGGLKGLAEKKAVGRAESAG